MEPAKLESKKCTRCRKIFIPSQNETRCLSCKNYDTIRRAMKKEEKINNINKLNNVIVNIDNSELDNKVIVNIDEVNNNEIDNYNEVNNIQELNDSEIDRLAAFTSHKLIEKDETISLSHPFSMKIYGSRGAGKSTWVVNYINAFHDCWNIILIVTPTLQQLLWTKLTVTNIIGSTLWFIQPDIIKDIKDYFKDKTLLILDDCMVHLMSNKISSNIISEIYTNGRHMNVSIISLEQSINSTKLTMRQNSDYFLLFKIIDNKLLKDFGLRFASIPNFKYFFEACQYCWKQDQPILISTKYIHTLR